MLNENRCIADAAKSRKDRAHGLVEESRREGNPTVISSLRIFSRICDSFCERCEANRGYWRLIGIRARLGFISLQCRQCAFGCLVVPVAVK